MRRVRWGVLGVLIFLASWGACAQRKAPVGDFLAKPYIQLGDAPQMRDKESLAVLWQTPDVEAKWEIEYRTDENAGWKRGGKISMQRVNPALVTPHRLYRATLSDLPPGAAIAYRVLKAGKPLFEATAHTRKHEDRYRFVVFGDCGANTTGQRKIAYQTALLQPDFVCITGDIVYSRGRMSEYHTNFFPIYNADQASPAHGAPLIRSTLFMAAPGNHDIGGRELYKHPDGMAYFLYWAQPLNGPLRSVGEAGTPHLAGSEEALEKLLQAAGTAYPRMANFSFDYGNAHWTILDSNFYPHWPSPALLSWLEKDLKAAQKTTWRFVAFHHPPFNSSKAHAEDEWMRRLCGLFEKYRVAIVFAGHVHNYQRTHPLKFAVTGALPGQERVAGRWTLDRQFDGLTQIRPDGVLYLVSGAGGANLYDPKQTDAASTWKEFTAVFKSSTHSLTAVDVQGEILIVRQVDANGREIDRFRITR